MRPLIFNILCSYNLRCVCFFLLIFFVSIKVYSQTQVPTIDPTPKIIPPSPNAASLGKYGSFPVSLNTGTPQIQIPLVSLEGQTLGTSISLSYHASGIKVDEIASNVGLGWSLNAGGVITRTVKGLPDESTYGLLSSYRPYTLDIDKSLSDGVLTQNAVLLDYYKNAALGNYDSEPDIFNFNIDGQSGKFVLDKDTEVRVRLIPHQDITIIPYINGSIIEKWKIITSAGIEYNFGETTLSKETTSEVSRTNGKVSGTTPSYVSSWYLTKVLDIERQDSVIYNYASHGVMTYVSGVSRTKTLVPGTNYGDDLDCLTSNGQEVQGESKVTTNGVYVSEIVTKRNKAILNYSSRSDLLYAVKLDNINVYSMPSNTLIKVINLNYEYFSSPRLKLKSIVEAGSDGSQTPPYIFEYLETGDYALPNRLSPAQDHWGFYNGAATNPSLLPTLNSTNLFSGTLGVGSGGANRYPHPECVKAGILNKITFPTGGYTIFEYEANRTADAIPFEDELSLLNYNNGLYNQTIEGTLVGGVRIKKISSYATASSVPVVKSYNYKDFNLPQQSSGQCLSRFKYVDYLSERKNKTTGGPTSSIITYYCNRYTISSSSVYPLTSIEGGHIVYTNVTVLTGETGEGGKSEYTYSFINDFTSFNDAMSTTVSNSWRRGQLLKQKDYVKDNSQVSGYRLIKTAENKYNYRENATVLNRYIGGLRIRYKFDSPFTYNNQGLNLNEFLTCAQYTYYEYNSRWIRLDTTIVTIDNIETKSYNKYNETGLHTNPTEIISVNSDGKQYSSKIVYSNEIDNTHPNYIDRANFTNRKMIVPISITNYINNNPINQGSLLYYKLFNNRWLPHIYYTINRLGTRDTQVIINYNINSLVTQVYKRTLASTPETYTYTSNGQVQNKNYGQLSQQFGYNTLLQLIQVTDENGLIKKFAYDGLQRLTMGYDRMKPDGTDIQANIHTAYQYSTPLGTDLNTYSKVRTATRYKDMPNTSKPMTEWQIVDGLGRLVGVFDSSNQRMKSYITYDNLGRQDRVYQPYLSAGGPTLPPAYVTPFKYNVYEASPLSRVLKSYNEDNTFVETQYGTNIANDVRIFTAGAGAGSATASGYYAANTLYKTAVINENGKTTELYKDKLGRVILTRKFSGTDKVETYNVYDDYGQLVAVLPPGSVSTTGAITHSLTFQYKFDVQNRLIEKKVPGAEPVKFFYDNRDLVTLTQDGNTKAISSTRYLGTQYDAMGRVLKTGWVTTSSPETFSTSGFTIPDDANKLTETQYYPNKSWVKHQGYKLLDPANPNSTNFVWSYIERRAGLEYTGNPVWTGKQHLLNGLTPLPNRPVSDADVYGVDWSVSAYNGLQKPYVTYRYMYGNASAGTQVRTYQGFTYDDAGRMTDMKYDYALNGAGVNASTTFTLTNMVYNHKDQLTEKNIGYKASSNTALQSIDYSYNLRGWLTSINNVAVHPNNTTIYTPASVGKGALQNLAVSPYISQAMQNVVVPFKQQMEEELPPPPVSDNNTDLFSENIYYNTADSRFQASPQYNGNIQAVAWQVAGRAGQGYGFTYDDLDRLTNAKYFDLTNTSSSGTNTTTFSTDYKFNESQTYDMRGNIMTLLRNGLNGGTNTWTSNGYTAATYGLIDNLTYTYNAQNQLLIVKDASLLAKGFKSVNNPNSTQYTYDANGNLKTDLNKGITNIDYNFLNLPQIITFTGGRSIQFIYDASGAKLRKIVNNNGAVETTDYVNGIEYKNNTLQRVAHTEGAIIRNENYAYQHEFVLRDHLGNARVSFRDGTNLGEATEYFDWNTWTWIYTNPNANNPSYNDGIVTASDIRQINNYYPFGLNMEGNWNGAEGTNKYQYNEKEWNDDFSLGWNDYGARFYDPAVGRWVAVDPLAEKYQRWSGYNYTKSNPIKYIDPDGMQVKYDWEAHDRGNKGVYVEETSKKGQRQASFGEAMSRVSKNDLISTDKRVFGVDIKGSDGKSGYISMTVWTPKTTVQNEGRPKGDENDFLFSAGYYTNGGTEFNISAEFTQSGSDDIGNNQKESFLNATIKISPNFTKETNATIGASGSINTPVASVGVEGSVGYTNTHTSGVQDFNVSWRVVEQYSSNNVRSSVNISTNPAGASYGVTLQPNSNTYTTNVNFFGLNYTVRVHLQTD